MWLVAVGGVVEGTAFGRYRLLQLLGRGGMGEVWRAHDTDTDRIVAIKLLPAHFSENEDFKRRFRREAHAAARLNTPHVIPIHHYGEIDGRLYVDMRLIEGRDLQTVLAAGPLEPSRAVRIIEGVAKALHAAHHVGLLHRDVKPSNILLDPDDFAYLIDFGIARAADETRLTKSGNTIGTFQYIAPERLGTRTEEDARADIYSLACVLYECLTGSPPFAEDTMAQLVVAHLSTPPPQPSTTEPKVPAQFDEVIATGMAKDPDQRYATTVELANAAHDAITTPIPRPEPRPLPLPATVPASVPTAPPTIAVQHRTPPPGKVDASAPTQQRSPVEVPTERREPFAERLLTPTAPSRGRWRRKAGLKKPFGVTVDSHGAVYVTDLSNKRVVMLPAGSTAQTVLPITGLNNPVGVAVDTAGTVYVTDLGNYRVLRLAAGSSTPTELPFTEKIWPNGVAVDTAGAVYVTDTRNNRVLRLAAGSNTQTELPFPGLNHPWGVAVDSAGTVYVTDTGNDRVLKLAAG